MAAKQFLIGMALFCVLVYLPAPVSSSADEEVSAASELIKNFPGLNNTITIDLRGIDASNILNFLAKKGEFNIVTFGSVGGSVSMILKDVTVMEALDIVVKTNQLAYEMTDNALVVMTEADYEAAHGKKFSDNRIMKVIQLKYASSQDVTGILDVLKSSLGSIVVDHTTGTVILIDLPERIEVMAGVIKQIERPSKTREFPTLTKVFRLDYAKVEDLLPVVSEALTKEVGIIRSDKRTNTMIITDLPKKMEEMERMISAFDEKTPQVLIQAKIVQVVLNENNSMGIEWQKLFGSAGNINIFASIPQISSAKEGFKGFTINSSQTVNDTKIINFSYIFNFLKSVGDTNIVATPHILASNGEEAKFMVGTTDFYVEGSTTIATGGTTTVSPEIKFIDYGVTFTVTPTINRKGFITLKVKPEVSDVIELRDAGNDTRVPVIQKSNVETVVTIKDGVTLMLAGLIKDEKVTKEAKIPILGDIPLLGWFFKSRGEFSVKKETIIFITPHIVTGDENMLSLMQDKKRLKPKKTLVGGTGEKEIKSLKKL